MLGEGREHRSMQAYCLGTLSNTEFDYGRGLARRRLARASSLWHLIIYPKIYFIVRRYYYLVTSFTIQIGYLILHAYPIYQNVTFCM